MNGKLETLVVKTFTPWLSACLFSFLGLVGWLAGWLGIFYFYFDGNWPIGGVIGNCCSSGAVRAPSPVSSRNGAPKAPTRKKLGLKPHGFLFRLHMQSRIWEETVVSETTGSPIAAKHLMLWNMVQIPQTELSSATHRPPFPPLALLGWDFLSPVRNKLPGPSQPCWA